MAVKEILSPACHNIEITDDIIQAQRVFLVTDEKDPFVAVKDGGLPDLGDALPGWSTVKAKRITASRFETTKATQVTIAYDNASGTHHKPGDIERRTTFETISEKIIYSIDNYTIDANRDLSASATGDHHIGPNSEGTIKTVGRQVLQLSCWYSLEPDDTKIFDLTDKVNSVTFEGKIKWKWKFKTAEKGKETTGKDGTDEVWRVNYQFVFIPNTFGWQHEWYYYTTATKDANGNRQIYRNYDALGNLSIIYDSTDFNVVFPVVVD